MKIQFCSDLHLEFPENKSFLQSYPLSHAGDMLILAGDIVPFAQMDKHADFFDYLADNFETTYWIPGNHEYYQSDISERSGSVKESIRSNVFLINNQSVKVDNTKFIFSTLWSTISQTNEWRIQKNMSDFHVITKQGKPFTADNFNQLHQESKAFLISELQQKEDCRTVVVTHHVPTLLNYPERYKGSQINEAFVVDLYDLIENSAVDSWIYGHTHSYTPEFMIGKTNLLTNQLGYVKYNEHQDFKTNKVL